MTGVGRIIVAVSLIAGFSPGSVSAQATKAGVVTTLEGNVTAARTTSAQPVALKFKDDVFVNDRVVTGDRSLARLLLGGKAVVTVRERSALTITEVPGRSTIDLDSGKVAVAVAKDRMRPGEQIEVKSPNAVAAVRGTVFVVEVIRASASASNAQGGVTVNHYVLTGQIALTVGTQVLNVAANNFASVTGTVVNSGVMSAAMRAAATTGFTPTGLPKVAGAEDDARQTAMNTTVATFTAST
ncbi:MAG: FecR domain-containing protein, partial [Candidatus Rokuibacteriota bacterium]